MFFIAPTNSELMDNAGDHTPNTEIRIFGDLHRGIVRVCSNQLAGRILLNESFYCQLAIDDSNDNFSARCIKRAVNNQNITMVYTGILHGVTGNPYKESGNWMLNQQLIQIKLLVYMVFGW